jgi:hypothetical protein
VIDAINALQLAPDSQKNNSASKTGAAFMSLNSKSDGMAMKHHAGALSPV